MSFNNSSSNLPGPVFMLMSTWLAVCADAAWVQAFLLPLTLTPNLGWMTHPRTHTAKTSQQQPAAERLHPAVQQVQASSSCKRHRITALIAMSTRSTQHLATRPQTYSILNAVATKCDTTH